MGKSAVTYITILDRLAPTPFSDPNDGANMGLPYYVSGGEQGLFDPLRNTLLYWVVRVYPFPCHPGVSIVSYYGYIDYSY